MTSIAEVIAGLEEALVRSVSIGRYVHLAAEAMDDAVVDLRHALAGTSNAEAEQLIGLFTEIQTRIADLAGTVGTTSAPLSEVIDRLRGDDPALPAELSTAPRSVPHPSAARQSQHIGIARDAAWAARQLAKLPRYDRRTHAVAYESDGHEHYLVSGSDEHSARAQIALRNSAHFPPPREDGWYGVVDHVETKLAMLMRERGIVTTTIVINNPKGVCDGAFGCASAVEALLPEGYVMMVWEPNQHTPRRLKGKARP